MGFGEMRTGDRDWLRLDDATKFNRNGDEENNSVAEYLDYAGAEQVAVYVSWCRVDQLLRGVGQADVLSNLQTWVATAASQDKSVVITLGYEPPDRLRKHPLGTDGCAGSHDALPEKSGRTIENISSVAAAIYSCLHGDGTHGCSRGTNHIDDVILEVGSETNWTGTSPTGEPGDALWQSDARFFYDVVNSVAANNRGFTTVLFGGPMLRGGDSWGDTGVSGTVYIREALNATSTNDDWDNAAPDGLRFDGFGAHLSHCTAPENRTLWNGCTGGKSVSELLDDLRSTLQNNAPASNHPELRIWITALIPTETLDGATGSGTMHGAPFYSQNTQRDDSRAIWNGVRNNYAGLRWGVASLTWNHLVNTGQDGFPTAGFMSCPGWTTWSSTTDPDCWPYVGKSVWTDSHDWGH
jgi:hypothetical protein